MNFNQPILLLFYFVVYFCSASLVPGAITYISAYRSPFSAYRGIELYHTALHVVVNGRTQIWEYGRYDGTDGKLRKRDKGRYPDEELVTSCKINQNVQLDDFIDQSRDFCQWKNWGIDDTFSSTNCFYYALHMMKKYGSQSCINLLENQDQSNPIRLFKNLIKLNGYNAFKNLFN